MDSVYFLYYVAIASLHFVQQVCPAAVPTTCINPSALTILQNPCDDHADKVKPTAAGNRTLQIIGKHSGDLRVHVKSVLEVVKKQRYHSPNPSIKVLIPTSAQDVSLSRNATQIKHTMESMFLYVEQLIVKEQQRQLQSEIPEKLCTINRAIVKILCSLYRMGETDQLQLQERSDAIKASLQVPPPNYHYTFKELFERFHGFLCDIMKNNGVETATVC